MNIDLIGLLKQQASGPLLEKAAALLGEDTSAVQKGLMAGSTGLLGGVMKTLSGAGGADLFNSLGDGSSLDKLQGHLAGGNDTVNFLGAGLDKARGLLGDNADSVMDGIAASSGMRSESVSSLMGMAAPMVMGILGKQKAAGLDLDGMKNMLGSQAGALQGLLPEGLSGVLNVGDLGSKLGGVATGALGAAAGTLSGASDALTGAASSASDLAGAAAGTAGAAIGKAGNVAADAGGAALKVGGDVMDAGRSGLGKLIPIIGTLLALALAFFFLKSCGEGKSMTDAMNDAASKTTGVVGDAAGKVGDAASSATDLAGDVAAGAVDAAGNTVNAVGTAAAGAVDAAGNVAAGAVDAAGNAAGAVGDAAAGAVDAAGNMVGDVAAGAAGAAGTALDKAGSMAGDAMNAVTSLGQKIGDKFRFTLPGGANVDVPEGSFEADMLKGLASNDASVIGKAYVLDRVYFASGSTQLTDESRDQITGLASVLNAYPDLSVNLRGHTDSQGSADANLALSTQRAEAVKAALINLAVNASRVTTEGLGPNQPIADNATAEGRALNRRIDLTLSNNADL